MAGLYETLKKDFVHAIIFALGATAEQLQVNRIENVQSCRSAICIVTLHLHSTDRENKQFSRIIYNGRESFNVNGETMRLGEYKENLRNINIDFDKQFNLYDARSRSCFWSICSDIRNELISKLAGMADAIISIEEWREQIAMKQVIIEDKEKELEKVLQKKLKLDSVLPEVLSDWEEDFVSYVTTLLNLDEKKRREKIEKLNVYRIELNEITNIKDNLQAQIEDAERNLNERNAENLNLSMELQGTAQPYQNDTIESLKLKIFVLKDKMELNTMRVSDYELLLPDLQRYRRAIENHLTFMNAPSNIVRNSLMITEDALLKYYQISNLKDELQLDKLSFEAITKEAMLNVIDNRRKDFEYFELVYPQRCFTAAARMKLQNSEIAFDELNAALNKNIDPNTFLYSKHFPELIEKLILSDDPYLLTNVFQPADEQHKCMIESILYNCKHTIVVVHGSKKKEIYNMLNKKCPGIFLNVHFVVVSKLPAPVPNFTIPETHWMKYCAQTENINRKLYQFMANQKNILRVESHQEVRDEFRRHSRKYVISADGTLTYTRVSNVDVLEFFKPGTKPKNMEILDSNIKKLLETNEKCEEIFASLFEEEHIPRDDPVDNRDLRNAVNVAKQQLDRAKQNQTNQIEALRNRFDEPLVVPIPQDFTERRKIEQRKLDAVNDKITAIQREIETHQAANGNVTTQIINIEKCIEIKMKLKRNETDCAGYTKTLKVKKQLAKENEKRLSDVNEKITRITNDLHQLKISTLRNVFHLTNEVQLDEQESEFNKQVMQLRSMAGRETIDPETIRLDIPNNFRPNTRITGTNEDIVERRETTSILNTLEHRISHLKAEINELQNNPDLNNRKIYLEIRCNLFNIDINNNLRMLFRQMYPENRITIVDENGQEIQIQNLPETQQQIINWMLFAAFHQYTNAPILFIDFRNKPDIITKIDPIIKWILNKSQIFCSSSHEQLHTLSTFAEMQIALSPMDRPVQRSQPHFCLWRRAE